MMFQSYALFPHMSVEANIAFGLKQDGMSKPDIEARVKEMLKLVRLEQFAKRKPHQLSGGQRQRVALARSVAKRPKVLLLDEPLGALDKKLREATQFELMDLQQDLGLTFVVVTHDQEEAMTMADRIAIMDKGEVMQVATPAEVYEAPASRFVADFVGNVNILEGTVAERTGDTATITGASGAQIRVQNAGDAQAGRAVAFAIRPEKIKVSSKRPETAANAMEGEIWDLAYLGDMTVYHVRLDDGQVVTASALNSSRTVEDPLSWEDRAWISFAPDAGIVLTR
jgi:putrescine transport system ATP-binding protein